MPGPLAAETFVLKARRRNPAPLCSRDVAAGEAPALRDAGALIERLRFGAFIMRTSSCIFRIACQWRRAMRTTRKISIGVGLLISIVIAVCYFALRMTPVVSRVPVPGSSMTAVVTADLAGCYDVELFDSGHPVPGTWQCLGPYASEHCALEGISTTSNIVSIAWTDGGYHYGAAIDVAGRRFVNYSNGLPVR
jgi:hypothetical protein